MSPAHCCGFRELSVSLAKGPDLHKIRSVGVKEPCSRLPGPQVPGLESPGFWDGGLTLSAFHQT